MQLGQLIQRAMQQGAANNGAADGANAANTIVPDGQNDPQDGIRAPQAQPNTDIADEQVPQAANDNKHDIADEQVPLATMISESGMVVPLAIGALWDSCNSCNYDICHSKEC